jgi:excisionase family DNA binding protein
MEAMKIEDKMGLFSTKEAAKRLGVSPPTVRELVRQRKLGVFRVGHKLMFSQMVLDLYLASVYEPSM